MKIQELIDKLEEIKKAKGDLNVMLNNYDNRIDSDIVAVGVDNKNCDRTKEIICVIL